MKRRGYWEVRFTTLFLLVVTVTIGGCATPQIVSLGHDKYMIYKEDHAGIFGSATALRNDVIEQADEFASSKEKVAYPLSAKSKPLQMCPACWATFEYHFLLADKNDSTISKTRLIPNTDIVTDDAGNISGEINIKGRDIHSELIKLDDLRKRGIISQYEFEEQKRKILK